MDFSDRDDRGRGGDDGDDGGDDRHHRFSSIPQNSAPDDNALLRSPAPARSLLPG